MVRLSTINYKLSRISSRKRFTSYSQMSLSVLSLEGQTIVAVAEPTNVLVLLPRSSVSCALFSFVLILFLFHDSNDSHDLPSYSYSYTYVFYLFILVRLRRAAPFKYFIQNIRFFFYFFLFLLFPPIFFYAASIGPLNDASTRPTHQPTIFGLSKNVE